MQFVYLIEDCDGWGHNYLKGVASTLPKACARAVLFGASEKDATRQSILPHIPKDDGVANWKNYIEISHKSLKRFFRIRWVEVDADSYELRD